MCRCCIANGFDCVPGYVRDADLAIVNSGACSLFAQAERLECLEKLFRDIAPPPPSGITEPGLAPAANNLCAWVRVPPRHRFVEGRHVVSPAGRAPISSTRSVASANSLI